MNVYFLVEGKQTEKKVYPAWLKHLLPDLNPVFPIADHSAVVRNQYCLVSGEGYPRILDETLEPAIRDINASGVFDFLVVCLDAENHVVEVKRSEVIEAVERYGLLPRTELVVIVQNRCFETWFLGNRRIFSRQPQDAELRTCIEHFNLYLDDPEQMEKPAWFKETCAVFHSFYLRAIFRERNIAYSKKYPGHVQDEAFLDQLRQRIADEPSHLKSFQTFLEFCGRLRPEAA